MKGPFSRPVWVFTLPGLALIALLVALWISTPGSSVAAPQALQAGSTNTLTFYSRTLQIGSPLGDIPSWFGASYDWLAYSTSAEGCGHCGPFITTLHLRNPATNKHIQIKSSIWGYNYSSGGATRGTNPKGITFAGNYLVWAQPGSSPPSGYQYGAGDYNCALCYYDVQAGQGGPVQGFQDLVAQDRDRVIPLDIDILGNLLVVVDNGTPDGSGTFWIGNLKTGEKKQLQATAKFQDVQEGRIALGGNIAWREADRLMGYAAAANKVVQIAPKATRLRTGGGGSPYFFWAGDSGVQRTTLLSNGQMNTQPLPRVSANFDAAYSSGNVGDIIAWFDAPVGNVSTFHVSSSGGGPDYLTRNIGSFCCVDVQMSLTADKVLYLTNDTPNYPQFDYQFAWLLKPDPAFNTVWQKADGPVAAGKAARSWLWGPQPNYLGYEAYDKGPGGVRLVEYFDKSRMEVNNPSGDPNGPFYVTNGLLATEMIGGEIQVGDLATIKASVPCTIPVAGDPRKDNPLTPSYATLAAVASIHGENQAPNRIGQPVGEAIDVNGVVSGLDKVDPSMGKYAAYAAQTGHNIPDLFWTYLTGMQKTYGFDWTFVLGYPITEAYWTQMRISGKDYPVLIQAYQRRVLTYTPAFPPEWRVQQGNVGQHYFEWRYVLNR